MCIEKSLGDINKYFGLTIHWLLPASPLCRSFLSVFFLCIYGDILSSIGAAAAATVVVAVLLLPSPHHSRLVAVSTYGMRALLPSHIEV